MCFDLVILSVLNSVHVFFCFWCLLHIKGLFGLPVAMKKADVDCELQESRKPFSCKLM
jgi:hypothetical protein